MFGRGTARSGLLVAAGLIAVLVFGLLAMHQLSSHHQLVTVGAPDAATAHLGHQEEPGPEAAPQPPSGHDEHDAAGGMFWSCLLILAVGLLLLLRQPRLCLLRRLPPVRLDARPRSIESIRRPLSLAELCVLRT